MDTNKMREQFESWYLDKHCGGIDRVRTCSNAPDTYYYTDTQTKWVAWQASREAVVVELPYVRSYPANEAASDVDYYIDEGRHDMKAELRKAVEAQGLKVEP